MARHAVSTPELHNPLHADVLHDVRALGTAAVFSEEMAALHAERAQGKGGEAVRSGHQSERFLTMVHDELDDTRATLHALDPANREIADRYLATHIGQPTRRHLGHRTFVEWLADPHRGATDDELFHVLSAHVEFVKTQQRHPAVQAEIKQEKLQYLSEIDDAVRNGHFSPHALTTAQRVMDTPVYIGDLWETTLLGINGYYRPTTGVVIEQSRKAASDDPITEIKRRLRSTTLVRHEGDHVQFAPWEARWSREGLAEYNAMSLRDGQFLGFDPSIRGEGDSRIYDLERKLLSILTTEGREQIAPSVVTRAHTSSGPRSAEWSVFMDSLDKAWGTPDMYEAVSSNLAELEGRMKGAHKTWSSRRCQEEALKTIITEVREFQRKQVVRVNQRLAA